LLGQPEKNTLIVEKGLKEVQPLISSDSLIDIALKNRKEYQIAQQKANLTKLKYKAVGTQNNPSFNFFASGGIKDGYEPDLYEGVWNYSIGIGFKMPLYDGGRTKKNQKVVQAEIQSNLEDVELNRRTIVNEVVEDQANLESAIKKIAQSELQFHQAEKAYALAETSFKSGVITNLELLDSSTSLSESGLSRLKAYIDYTLNLYKLKLALGEQIY
jgi:outer membrane protein TolC